ncbi:hypothetical protein [Caldilinea sp.]|uniref:SHOCT-like domain-containing protein n=1 Tax=Caldilinea sp. TaxID=2293560 RepID=UPI002CC1BA18|nr:hypothetical protein [Anaerolineales bacterium]HQY90212.1 hypothetical protein [Caldilinea sp.]
MDAMHVMQSGLAPTLILRCIEGNLTLNGWDRPEVQVRVRDGNDTLTVEQQDGVIVINCEEDLWLQVPVQSSITVDAVEGNASFSLLLNSLTIGAVEGNAVVHSVNTLTANQIEGNFAAHLMAGDLRVDVIEGNAQIAKVAGAVWLGQVEGNLVLNEIGGSIEAAAEGNVKAQALLAAGQQCSIRAEGGITCEIPRGAGGVFSLKAEGHIRVRGLGEERSMKHGVLDFEREPAHARLTLEAEGNILLQGVQPHSFTEADFAGPIAEEMAMRSVEITQQITAQIEAQVVELSRQLDDKLSRLGTNEELATSIQEKVQAAMRRAEEKLAEAMRKVEQRAQESESRRRKSAGWAAPPAAPLPPAPAKPKRPPATDEERMLILRMVEQGKISVEQAEKLFAALNGAKQER